MIYSKLKIASNDIIQIMVKAIIFDIGGVLITNPMQRMKEDIKKTLKISSLKFNKAWDEITPLLGSGKINEFEYWHRFLIHTGSTQKLPEESLLTRKYKVKTNQGMVNMAKSLKNNGYKLAVLSDTNEVHLRIIRTLGILDLFDVHVFSNEVGLRKSEKEIFTLTLDKLNVFSNEVIFIDDRKENITMAKSLNMNAILFKNNSQLKNDLKKNGVKI
jgi:epoxide hydrolase-like predicted phosphatase